MKMELTKSECLSLPVSMQSKPTKTRIEFHAPEKAITKSGAEDWQLTLEEEVSVL